MRGGGVGGEGEDGEQRDDDQEEKQNEGAQEGEHIPRQLLGLHGAKQASRRLEGTLRVLNHAMFGFARRSRLPKSTRTMQLRSRLLAIVNSVGPFCHRTFVCVMTQVARIASAFVARGHCGAAARRAMEAANGDWEEVLWMRRGDAAQH